MEEGAEVELEDQRTFPGAQKLRLTRKELEVGSWWQGLTLRRVSTSRTLGLDWNVGVSLQRYRAGPRPELGVQAGFEMPIGDW